MYELHILGKKTSTSQESGRTHRTQREDRQSYDFRQKTGYDTRQKTEILDLDQLVRYFHVGSYEKFESLFNQARKERWDKVKGKKGWSRLAGLVVYAIKIISLLAVTV